MKNSNRFLCTSLVLAAISSSVFAQSSSNSAAVTATLVSDLTIIKNVDVAFGNVTIGSQPIMSASSASNPGVGAGATLGKFTVTGAPGASVLIHYDAAVTLTNSTGAADGQLTFLPSVARTYLIPLTNGNTEIANDGYYAINTSSGTGISTPGIDYIFVGGMLGVYTAGTLQPIPALGTIQGAGTLKAGNYTGTFNISATYN